MAQVGIGLVGYYQFVRGYPIGPELRERLELLKVDDQPVPLKEMNWGPIAIVQDFQASPVSFDRMILISAVDRGLAAGTVTCRHWLGGKLDTLAVQDRVFEAVTGIISLDNLLVIGEHFGIWPPELIMIEVQLADTAFGDIVLSELEIKRDDKEINIVGENPLAPDMQRIVERVFELARMAVQDGVKGLPDIQPISAGQLSPLADVCHNQFMSDCSVPGETTEH